MANFFVKRTDSFTVTLPFSIIDEESPVVVITQSLKEYPEVLQSIPEDKLEFHWCKFKKADFGLDCLIRELSMNNLSSNLAVPQRVLSEEKLLELRVRYLLQATSFIEGLTFTKAGNYDALTQDSEEKMRTLPPEVLRVFLMIASQVWDTGINPKMLLTKEDYLLLRNDPDGLAKIEASRTLTSTAIVSTTDPDVKKN
jgi:hypothetical protein